MMMPKDVGRALAVSTAYTHRNKHRALQGALRESSQLNLVGYKKPIWKR